MGLRYDHPNATVRREACHLTAAGTGTHARDVMYQKRRLKAAHFSVVTAGTADAFAATIQNGTTSVGVSTLGTNTAGYTASVTGIDATIASLATLNVAIAGDNTGVATVTYEFEVLPDAVQST